MEVPLTQRAYTLRLKGADPNDQSWREKLWKTHEAVNKGAKAFGDWLLTMRGGLSHGLVDMKVKTKDSERDPNDDERHDRRILLALSWLSVESEEGAPSASIISHDVDTKTGKVDWKTKDALRNILQLRGLGENDIKHWVEDCSASLSAAIRDDAVWVDRSKVFDDVAKNIGNSLTRDEVWDILDQFFGSRESYLKSLKTTENDEDDAATEEGAKNLVIKAGNWLVQRFPKDKGADFSQILANYKIVLEWASKASRDKTGKELIHSLAGCLNAKSNDLNGIETAISYTGMKKAKSPLFKNLKSLNDLNASRPTDNLLRNLKKAANDKVEEFTKKEGSRQSNPKGNRPWSDTMLKDVEEKCGFEYSPKNGSKRHFQFAVMLDHAARRVSIAHTWIKRAEAERRKFEEDAGKISSVSKSAKEWLDGFCEERSGTSGAIEGYRIRKRAIDGWKEIIKAWSKPECKTEEDRIAAARTLQDDPEIDKFGDIQLFEALAVDEAKCVWHKDGNPNKEPDSQPLLDYVAATDAEAKKRRFKVPAYRHPDALLHPVFCDFGNSRWDIKFDIHEYKKKNKKASTVNIHGLKMGLLDGNDVKETQLQWSSKLLVSDLALKQKTDGEGVDVSRASRLGRAIAKVAEDASVNIAGLFEQKDWNGRLQSPREQLENIARQKSPAKADSLRNNIKWLISFSPRLQPQGPWVDYIEQAKDKSPFERTYQSGAKKGQKYVSLTGWPLEAENKNRNGMARLILSRLPGLRVLSVDLGHRYAAACAVWETLTREQVSDACKRANVKLPSERDMYLHLKSKVENHKDKTTIYRRIGADTLNGNPHPAPWARLDRQFLIKLQGEEEAARKASPAEIEAFCKLEQELGRKALEDRSFQVDELMSDAVRMVRLGLKRHGDKARIAHYLITDKKVKPGGVEENLDKNGRVEMLTDALELWHDLFSGSQWTDEWAKENWDEQIKPLFNGADLFEPSTEEETLTSKERKKRKEELRNKLKPVAEKLAKQDNMKLHVLWATRWREDDANWKKRLRWLNNWILPRGKGAKDPVIRHVGGLSLTRIATIKSLYQVQKAYFQRFTPDGRQMDGKKPKTAGEGFGQSILDAMEHMRGNRVKQLASRIVEAALGIGKEQAKINKKDQKRPTERVYDPCHAVVIENLTHYRPEETRTRRENRQLMTWSSSKVKKYLSEGCQLHGLHLREVQAGYTSRQDSRTGAPGIRCEDLPVKDFFESPFWKKETERAEKKQKENKGDARDKYLLALKEKWSKENTSTWSIRIPQKGGDIFVSADEKSPAAKGLQADLNAAANIGLKALLDPDWPGKWWYVPCDSKAFKPFADKVKGSTVIDVSNSLKTVSTNDAPEDSAENGKKKRSKQKSEGKSREVVNLWRDGSSSDLNNGQWDVYAAYQSQVQYKVIENLRKQAGLYNE